jgi:hypothetical protein
MQEFDENGYELETLQLAKRLKIQALSRIFTPQHDLKMLGHLRECSSFSFAAIALLIPSCFEVYVPLY